MGKSTKDARDHFYRQGKREGYRARSAYKLIQLDEKYGLFGGQSAPLGARHAELYAPETLGEHLCEEARALLQGGEVDERPMCVLDLCAAPGSWSQVLSRSLADRGTAIVAVDLQKMAPIPGVAQVVGDITTQETAAAVEAAMQRARPHASAHTTSNAGVDLVVCDGAPDVTGVRQLDEYGQLQLLTAALTMTARLLRVRGTFVAKVLLQEHSDSANLLLAQLRRLFEHVEFAKPPSSRDASAERFVVCMRFSGPSESSGTMQRTFLGDLQGYNA